LQVQAASSIQKEQWQADRGRLSWSRTTMRCFSSLFILSFIRSTLCIDALWRSFIDEHPRCLPCVSYEAGRLSNKAIGLPNPHQLTYTEKFGPPTPPPPYESSPPLYELEFSPPLYETEFPPPSYEGQASPARHHPSRQSRLARFCAHVQKIKKKITLSTDVARDIDGIDEACDNKFKAIAGEMWTLCKDHCHFPLRSKGNVISSIAKAISRSTKYRVLLGYLRSLGYFEPNEHCETSKMTGRMKAQLKSVLKDVMTYRELPESDRINDILVVD